jgi:hypothetical protein
MRRLYDNKKFYSVFEHITFAQYKEMVQQSSVVMRDIEMKYGRQRMIPQVSFMVQPRPENQEVIINNVIGIA